MRIDHVIWTTADLAATAELVMDRYGLKTSGGGQHEGHGTYNLIVPLGGGFLELLAIEDRALARESPIGRAVAAAPDGLFGWVLAVADVAPFLRRGLSALTLRRGRIEMKIAGLEEAMSAPWLPFFIERPSGGGDPGGAGTGGGIASIELRCDRDELLRWTGGAELPIDYASAGDKGLRSVTLNSGVVIRSDEPG